MPRKRQSTKSRIVKAAWNLFFKKGYDNTTVEDIIVASKTSRGSFYHYFKGKESLLNSMSDLFDDKYRELAAEMDPSLSCYDKLLLLNHELFYMIEHDVNRELLALLYSSQLVTKGQMSLSDKNRFYFEWVTQILEEALEKKESAASSSAEELMHLYAMYERALLYDWALAKGSYSLYQYSDKLLPHLLDTFITGV